MLGLDLAAPDHRTLSRRAETSEAAQPGPGPSGEPTHLLVDRTGLKLCGPGAWLVEKRVPRTRRGWRKLHLATDADTGRILASALADHDADDGSQTGPLLDRVHGPVASSTADYAFGRDDVYAALAARHTNASVIVPPRSSAVPSVDAEPAPTRRDVHVRRIAERGRVGRQKASGYRWRALVEADVSR